MNETHLSANHWDHAAAILRAALGAVPIAGAGLSEVITALVPNQRIDRVVRYLQRLTATLEELDRRVNTQNARTVDLLEDTLAQSTRALSDERNTYLASLMADSVDVSPDQYEFNKKLLQILAELTDRDIEVLKAHADVGSKHALERDWPRPGSMSMGERRRLSPEEKFRWESQQISLDVHLAALERYGLLEHEDEAWEGRAKSCVITPLGRLLLTRIFGGYFDR